jgi:UDP-glucose 4-epimerase
LNLIVTGGCGFIGSHFVDLAISKNDKVIIIDNLLAGNKENIENSFSTGNIELIQNDIRNLDLIKSKFSGIDAVIHFAARTGVIESLEKSVEFTDVNVLGTLKLLELCKEFKIPKFVLASTGAVYGNNKAPFTEAMIPDPISPYAASKVAAENFCKSYSNTFGIQCMILRFTNVFGPRKSFGPYANVIPKFVRAALRNESITIFGNGDQERDFVYVKDVANACYQSIKNTKSGVYNIGTGKNTSLNYLIEILEKTIPHKFKKINDNFRDGEAKYAYSSIENAKSELHYSPKFSLQEGIQEYIEYEKTQLESTC